MVWQGDRCDYLPWLEEQMFPGDWTKQADVAWAVLAESLGLSFDPQRDMAAIRDHLNREAARRTPAVGRRR